MDGSDLLRDVACNALAPVALDPANMLHHRVTLLAAATALVLAGPTDPVPGLSTDTPVAATGTQNVEQDVARAQPATMSAVGVTVPKHASQVERDAVSWAVGQFESAGLELPSVAISFSTDSTDCSGEQGVYRLRSGEHSVVVCAPDVEGAGIDLRRKRTLLHELAHAWDHTTLAGIDRRHLQQRFNANDWYAADRPWEQRPVEQLAETLTWGLLGQPRRPLLIDRACTQVHADFRIITGRNPLGPIEPRCEIDESDLPTESGHGAAITSDHMRNPQNLHRTGSAMPSLETFGLVTQSDEHTAHARINDVHFVDKLPKFWCGD